MKSKKKELSLKKVTVTRLDISQMGRAYGGSTLECDTSVLDCGNTVRCTIGCSDPTCPEGR